MSAVPATNSRASLLAGLRTGGVRSGSYPQAPHTAAPGGSFNTNPPPRFINNIHEVDEQDELADQFSQTLHFRGAAAQRQVPMTAAADQQFYQYQQQIAQAQAQQAQNVEQLQMLQYQRLQLEMLKMQQALQHQQMQQQAQYQNMMAPSGRRQSQGPARRASYDTIPATAAPAIHSFAQAAQMRAVARQQQGQQMYTDEQQVPMSAAIGGKFAARGLNPNASAFAPEEGINGTYVISGGTQLGVNTGVPKANSRSDTATSWRRSPDSPASPQQAPFSNAQPPRFKISPPPEQQQQQLPPRVRARPAPLKFSPQQQPADDDSASSSDAAPVTPPSAEALPRPLTPREEASKRLYEGLGHGRPAPQIVNPPQMMQALTRIVSQTLRQPIGPPSGTDELSSCNFASRIRSQTIANFNTLADARERREVAAY
jgi:hypothetical protein